MKIISAAEANRQFSDVLRRATRGEIILITSHGKAVATLGPANVQSPTRAAARSSLFARLKRQKASGKRDWNRDDLYRRGNEK